MTTRVLYAPRNISGQPAEYAEAVRPLGYEAEVWSYGEAAYGFAVDRVIDQERLLTEPAYRWDVFDAAVRGFDVFHFQYGRSLLNPEGVTVPDLWDIPLLKSLGKRVHMHFRGSDVRLRSVHLEREPDSYFRDADISCDEPRILGKVAIARRFCDSLLVSTPGLLDYVPDARWVPHVVDVSAWQRPPRAEPAVPVVAHIPSSRSTKGSEHVDRIARALEAEGVCRYTPLSGLSREEVRAALQAADLVVDSLTIGDHGLISVEAMAAGAIPLAHIHETNRERNPGVPVVEATVATLGDVLRALAGDPGRRAELRTTCARWVAEHHDRPVVGRLLADIYAAPPTAPLLPYPDWPRSDSRHQVAKLEAEVERLRAQVDPLVQGLPSLRRSTPGFVVDRLLARVGELEAALRAADPASPLLDGGGRRDPAGPPRGLADLVKANPAVHRAARRVATRLRGLRR